VGAVSGASSPHPAEATRLIARATVVVALGAVALLVVAEGLVAAGAASGGANLALAGRTLLLAVPVARSIAVVVWGHGPVRALGAAVAAALVGLWLWTHVLASAAG
jgi:hypothetical protein